MKMSLSRKTPLFLIAVVLVALAVAGYFATRPALGPNLVSENNPIGLDTSEYNGSYRFTSVSDPPDQFGTIINEVDKDGNYRTKTDDTISLTVGDTTVVRATEPKNSRWRQSSNGLYDPAADAIGEEFLEGFRASEVTAKGTDKCFDGLCRVYSLKEKKLENKQTSSTSEGQVKVDAKTNRLRELIVEYTRTTSSGTEREVVTTTFEYDVDFEPIVLPEDFLKQQALHQPDNITIMRKQAFIEP